MRWMGALWVVEIKTGAPDGWHGLQLAAYAMLTNARGRIGVYLRPDGWYRVRVYDDPGDQARWMETLHEFYIVQPSAGAPGS